MPNAFAQLVFFTWPLVAILMFAAQPPARAVAGAVVMGYLLLPERVGLNFPLIPVIDKFLMTSLTATVVVALAIRRQRQIAGKGNEPPFGRARWLVAGLIVLTLVTPFVTVFTNGDPIIAGPRYIPGLRLYDSVSLMMSAGIMIVPFLLGMRVLGTVEAQAELLRVLAVAACAYSLLVLFEVRMSPQLSNWIYGFFPHSFAQHVRGSGFRPVVFLTHGLWLAIFLCMAVLAACAIWRQSLRDRVASAPWLAAALWLALTLVLTRSLGATALMLVFAPLILFASLRQQVIVAAVVAACVLVYPVLRGAGLVPTDTVHSLAQSVSEERAASLKFRLDQEDTLLERANDRALAGWGSWGRNRVFDPVTGRDLSVTDGIWVITIGTFGWFGYLAQFGLLTAPLLLLLRRRGHEIAPVTAGLAVVMAAALGDLIPNATLTPVTWLCAGALAGLVVRAQQPQAGAAPAAAQSVGVARVAAGTGGPLSPAAASQVRVPAMPGRSGTLHRRQRRT